MKWRKKWIIPLSALVALVIALSVTLGAGAGVDTSGSLGPDTAQAAGSTEAAQTAGAAGSDAVGAEAPMVMMHADMTVMYASVEQLTKAADLVVRGRVTQVSYVDFNTSTHTVVTLKVSKCLKGDVAQGDEVTIAEVGGVTSMAAINGDKFGAPTKLDAQTMVAVLLEGAPLTEVGDECLYFLGTGSIGVVPGRYYVPLGAFQGRFEIQNAVAERFVPVDWQGGKYTALTMAESALDQTVLQGETD